MAILITDLTNGEYLAVDDTTGKSWITTVDETALMVREKETLVEDLNTAKGVSTAVRNDHHSKLSYIYATEPPVDPDDPDEEPVPTNPPIAGTIPDTWLIDGELHTQNSLSVTFVNSGKKIKELDEHITNTEAELAKANEVLDALPSTPPTGDTENVIATGLPVDIPSQPDDSLNVNLTSVNATKVTYVGLRVKVDHPSAPEEKLMIILEKDGHHKEMFYGDGEDNTYETNFFNGLNGSGDWTAHFLNDHTSSKNQLLECELIIYY